MNAKDSDIREMIWTAAVNGDWETVKQLLEREPSLIDVMGDVTINERDWSNWTLLHLASAINCDMEVLEYLISKDIDANGSCYGPLGGVYGFTPLFAAVEYHSHVDVLKYLVFHGADVNARICCETPLHFAACHSDANVVKCLVSLGADINEPDEFGGTPLHHVAETFSDMELWEFLIFHGADVNVKRNDGWTPFLIAAKKNTIEVLKYLVSQGADLNIRNKKGRTAFDVANTDEKKIYLLECMSNRSMRTIFVPPFQGGNDL